MIPIRAREVMSSPPVTVAPEDSLETAGRLMREHDIGSVVVTADGAVRGLVERSDLLDCILDDIALSDTPVAEVSAPEPPAVTAGTPLREALSVVTSVDERQVPVTDESDVVGVLSTTDVATYLPQLLHRIPTAEAGDALLVPGHNETSYERADWDFEDDGDRPSEVEQGETFRFEKQMADEDVTAFAEVSGDTNRLHLEDGFAAETRFGHRIVHGLLVAGTISAAIARLPGTAVYLSQSLSFLQPVAVGETVTAEITASEQLGDDRWRLTTVVRSEDDEVVIDGEATVLLWD